MNVGMTDALSCKRSDLSNAVPCVRKVCLFAEFHRGNFLPGSTIHYLTELVAAGFTVHAALSGSRPLEAADRETLDRLGVHGHPRQNAGLDFGAWQELIHAGAVDGADEVLLANDSVFGPFARLAPIMRSMAGFDAWGMVESREGRPHLQSWFVWMSGNVFRRAALQRVFAQPFAAMSKAEIIVHGELGLAAAMEGEGVDWGARYRAPFRVLPSRVVATNPMHFHWRRLLSTGTVPFLKVELLRDNPSRILGVGAWRRVLREMGMAAGSPLLASIGQVADGRASETVGARQAMLQLAIREDRLEVLRDLVVGCVHRNGRG